MGFMQRKTCEKRPIFLRTSSSSVQIIDWQKVFRRVNRLEQSNFYYWKREILPSICTFKMKVSDSDTALTGKPMKQNFFVKLFDKDRLRL